MSATHCALPGCSWSRQKKEKRSLFTILNPDAAKSAEEKAHREGLIKYILSVRDHARGDIIKDMLHKES